MYLNHTIDHSLGAYHGTYKMEIILIFHGKSKNPPHFFHGKSKKSSSLDIQQGGFLLM